MNNRGLRGLNSPALPFALRVVSVIAALVTATAAGSDLETGHLTSPKRISLLLDDRVVGTALLAVGTPVRVITRKTGMLRVHSAVGCAWVSETSVLLTGEELVFEERDFLDAISGKEDRLPGATTSRPVRMRTAWVPRVSALPTRKENIPSCAPEAEKDVLAIVNKERLKKGLSPPKWDSDLARAARFHSAHMANNGYFDHDALLPGKGKVPGCFARIEEFSPSSCSENIAVGNPTANDVMRSLMNSPGHRDNILSKSATKLGVGCVGGYWVQVFGY